MRKGTGGDAANKDVPVPVEENMGRLVMCAEMTHIVNGDLDCADAHQDTLCEMEGFYDQSEQNSKDAIDSVAKHSEDANKKHENDCSQIANRMLHKSPDDVVSDELEEDDPPPQQLTAALKPESLVFPSFILKFTFKICDLLKAQRSYFVQLRQLRMMMLRMQG